MTAQTYVFYLLLFLYLDSFIKYWFSVPFVWIWGIPHLYNVYHIYLFSRKFLDIIEQNLPEKVFPFIPFCFNFKYFPRRNTQLIFEILLNCIPNKPWCLTILWVYIINHGCRNSVALKQTICTYFVELLYRAYWVRKRYSHRQDKKVCQQFIYPSKWFSARTEYLSRVYRMCGCVDVYIR